LLGFGPGLGQVLTPDAWAAESGLTDRPLAPADLTLRSEAVPSGGSEVVFLGQWEATGHHDDDDHHGGGGGGHPSPADQITLLTTDAVVQAHTAQALVNAGLFLLSTNNPSAALKAQAFADLRLAAADEALAATDLKNAATVAINNFVHPGVSMSILNAVQGLIAAAGTQSSIATQMALDAVVAQKLDPPSPSASYVQQYMVPLANQGVSNTQQAQNDSSAFH